MYQFPVLWDIPPPPYIWIIYTERYHSSRAWTVCHAVLHFLILPVDLSISGKAITSQKPSSAASRKNDRHGLEAPDKDTSIIQRPPSRGGMAFDILVASPDTGKKWRGLQCTVDWVGCILLWKREFYILVCFECQSPGNVPCDKENHRCGYISNSMQEIHAVLHRGLLHWTDVLALTRNCQPSNLTRSWGQQKSANE